METHSHELLRILGIERQSVSHAERLLSGLGGFLGIAAIYAVSRLFLPSSGAGMLIASMGASAVLLFAVPHGALSQPWPLMGGHLVSALIGVTCARLVSSDALAAPMAVGAAIVAMYYLRCLHPPGGATAFVAVVGGPDVRSLGFDFVIAPVMLDATILLACAVLFNGAYRWRRYPAYWSRPRGAIAGAASTRSAVPVGVEARGGIPVAADAATGYPPITHEEFVLALSEIDTFIDVTEEDLLRIYELATRRAVKGRV